MRLLAISDLHVRNPDNRATLQRLAGSPDDWLVLGGDIGEDVSDLVRVIDTLGPRFARLVWVPGNHDLWTIPTARDAPGPRLGASGTRGVERYLELVEACRSRGVLTPEDPYERWPGDGPPTVIAPLFLLYDYSFRPDEVRREDVLAWSLEEDIVCVDEYLLHPDPFASRDDWCAARVAHTRERLDALPADVHTVLINHFPLRRSHARLPAVPRFTPWCGTRETDDWHVRYRARAVVYGHLHIARTHVDDGVPFEEVSLGYPHQYQGRAHLLRQILPRPAARP